MLMRRALVGGAAAAALLILSSGGGHAQTAKQMEKQMQALQDQIQAMQSQLNQMKEQQRQQAEQAEVVRQQAATAEMKVKEAEKKAGGLGGTYHVGGVTLKVGGFIEAAGIYRTNNTTSDVATPLGAGEPFGANTNNHLSEFRESARQSRLSLLATGSPDPVTNLTAYFETDFLGQAATANSNQSNSYNLRLRHAYAEYDRSDFGFSLVGGQTWSLATLNTAGESPLKTAIPLTIDANYNVGFNWLRVPQIRLIDNFAPGFWGAVSFESPQAVNIYTGGNALPETVLINNPGTGSGLLNGAGAFTLDVIPDVIVKVAAEPGWGHYELFGVGREFRTNVTAPATLAGHKEAWGGGIGAGALLPVVPKMLDIQLQAMAGDGIGKYGAAQLPDFTINPAHGNPSPIPEVTGMIGVIGHPDPALDLYGYFGIEQESTKSFTKGGLAFGYGNGAYTNAGCVVGNAATPSGCNVKSSMEGQVGAWWKFYQGEFGMMELGASYAHLRISTFGGTTGSPNASNNIVMTSFRYYPF